MSFAGAITTWATTVPIIVGVSIALLVLTICLVVLRGRRKKKEELPVANPVLEMEQQSPRTEHVIVPPSTSRGGSNAALKSATAASPNFEAEAAKVAEAARLKAEAEAREKQNAEAAEKARKEAEAKAKGEQRAADQKRRKKERIKMIAEAEAGAEKTAVIAKIRQTYEDLVKEAKTLGINSVWKSDPAQLHAMNTDIQKKIDRKREERIALLQKLFAEQKKAQAERAKMMKEKEASRKKADEEAAAKALNLQGTDFKIYQLMNRESWLPYLNKLQTQQSSL
eukprot:gene22686-2427_t